MGFFDQIKNGLRKSAEKLTENLGSLLHKGTPLSGESAKAWEEHLISADLGVETAKAVVQDLQERVRQEGKNDPETLRRCLREALYIRLALDPEPWKLADPAVILLAGVNGAGKTTTAGKLAVRFSGEGRKVLLAAGDTFRAAAEEQLTEWAGRAKVEIVRGAHGASPSSVVFDALKSGLSNGFNCFIVDTAGRLHNRSNLMEELQKIVRVSEKSAPGIKKEKWLVLDANTGQNALNQAREFNREMELTGLVLTKLDGTAKGGMVVALCDQLKLPVRFIGVGEGLDDLVPFDPKMFVEALVTESPQGV
jgi:fused signal recognition particle receptor